MTIDSNDKQLLALLRDNARQPTAVLARKLGLSRTTVKDKINRLEASGVISGYTIRSSDDYQQSLVKAQVMIVADAKKSAAVIRQITKMTAASSLYTVSGIYDFIVTVTAESTRQLDEVLDAIGAIDGVEKTLSSVILSCKFSR